MYLYVRQACLTDDGGLGWAGDVRSRLQQVVGRPVDLWQNAYSSDYTAVRWTSWSDDLGALDDALTTARRSGDAVMDDRGQLVPGSTGEQLFRLEHGEPDVDAPGNFVRSLRAVGTAGHLDRGLQTGIEVAKKSEELTGRKSLFIRALTGQMGIVAWLTPFDSLGDFQAANEKLLSGSSWLWYRDHQAEAAGGSGLSTALYRRIGG